jgi:hypothetical protein
LAQVEEVPPDDFPSEDLMIDEGLPTEEDLQPEVDVPSTESPIEEVVPDSQPSVRSHEAEKQPATPAGGIFRLDPPDKLLPVSRDELKPGVVYWHDSPTLGRPVWSFLQANGQFWHAFGPGTTQAVEHFDLRMTEEERKAALKKIDPRLAFDVSATGAKVFFRLEADNKWKLVRTNSVPSIYDLETNQRWEKQWDRYLPVIHFCGDTWEHRKGWYVPQQQGTNWREDAAGLWNSEHENWTEIE